MCSTLHCEMPIEGKDPGWMLSGAPKVKKILVWHAWQKTILVRHAWHWRNNHLWSRCDVPLVANVYNRIPPPCWVRSRLLQQPKWDQPISDGPCQHTCIVEHVRGRYRIATNRSQSLSSQPTGRQWQRKCITQRILHARILLGSGLKDWIHLLKQKLKHQRHFGKIRAAFIKKSHTVEVEIIAGT